MTIDTRELSRNPVKGIRRLFHYDHATDEFTIETIYQTPFEENRRLYNDAPGRFSPDGGDTIARIPDPVLFDLYKRGVLADEKEFRKWLDDPDNRVFRTRPGRMSK